MCYRLLFHQSIGAERRCIVIDVLFNLADDAIFDMDDFIRLICHAALVRYDHDRHSLSVQVLEYFHHLDRRFAVQRPRRFIGKNHLRLCDQSTCNGDALFLSAAHLIWHAVDVTDPAEKNYKDQIPYTPRHSGSASVTWMNPWANISYSVVASDKRYALPQNIKSNQIDSYMEHSLSANKSFKWDRCQLRIQGEILNLLNKNYDIIQYYPMPGRSWRLSVSIIY